MAATATAVRRCPVPVLSLLRARHQSDSSRSLHHHHGRKRRSAFGRPSAVGHCSPSRSGAVNATRSVLPRLGGLAYAAGAASAEEEEEEEEENEPSSSDADEGATQRVGTTVLPSPHKVKLEQRRSIQTLPVQQIIRPLGKTRANDQDKVAWLMQSIEEIGLQPIDVLEVEGRYYGFSGCHRFEAHVKLGRDTIKCRVIKATKQSLDLHMR